MCEKGYHIPFATGPKLYALCILDDKSGLRGQRRPPQARSPRATTSLYNKSNFLYSKGSINLNGFTGYRHKIQEGDFAVILDSLQELFRERGDSVTPKQLAERMEHKLNRSVHYTHATYLCTLLGLVTRQGNKAGDKNNHYVVFDADLLAQKRAQYCRVLGGNNEMKSEFTLPK
jgi:hypothetical protein